jgi:hypothetical protein
VALLVFLACEREPVFTVDVVEPATVPASVRTQVLVRGEFPVLAKIDFDRPDASMVRDRFDVAVVRGEVGRALQEVVRRDPTTLAAVVPADLEPGVYALEVVDPRGRRRRLDAALTVVGCLSPDGGACADVDECATDNGGCDPNANCTSTVGGRTCVCKTGFVGDGGACADVDECATDNGGCDPNASCTNTPGGRTCACNAGFSGDGGACADVDECATDNGGCDPNASCTNTAGGRACACRAGFSGDGGACADVDECATDNGGCDPNASCTNTPGGRSCACKTGFSGDGGVCADVDECASSNGGCDPNASCTNTPGGRTCACSASFSGDGGVCLWTSPALSGLVVSAGQLTFDPGVRLYAVTVPSMTSSVSVTASVPNPAGATITIDGASATSGIPRPVAVTSLPRTISVVVRSQAGVEQTTTLVFTPPTVLSGYVKAFNADSADSFGTAFAMSADGSTLAVGAPGEDTENGGISPPTGNAGSNSGMVYVLIWSGTAWVQQAHLKASNTNSNDAFGSAVALSANGNTLVVGAPQEDSAAVGVNGNQGDNTAQQSGAVYVFVRSGASWSQQAYLKASNTNAGDAFGSSVSLSSDGSLLAVGAPAEASNATGVGGPQADNSAPASGAVYVFQRSFTTWAEEAYVKSSNAAAGDAFGWSVALNGTGTTLVVGAPGEDSSATSVNGDEANNAAPSSGAVYVFTRTASWSQAAYVKAPNTDPGDAFGAAVSVSSSGTSLAVGAPGEAGSGTGVGALGQMGDNSLPGSGAAYLFGRTASTWSFTNYLKASNSGASDGFGVSLALSADGSTLAVGAPGEDSTATGLNGNQLSNGASSSGAAYVFLCRGPQVALHAYVKAFNTDPLDEFGAGVALSSDGSVMAISAPGEAGSLTNSSFNGNPGSGAVNTFAR